MNFLHLLKNRTYITIHRVRGTLSQMILVERTIQTVKKTLRNVVESGNNVYLGLLALRTAPSKDNGKSPAFKLINRNPRTLLPSVVPFRDFQKSNTFNAETIKKYYNQHAKGLQSLSPNVTTRVRHNNN